MLTLWQYRDHREKEEKDGFSFAFVNFKLHLFLIHKLSAKEKFLGRSSFGVLLYCLLLFVCVGYTTDNGGWR